MRNIESTVRSLTRRQFIFALSLGMLGCSKDPQPPSLPQTKTMLKPIFNPGTCIAVSLLCGGYGAAIVLQLDFDDGEVRHLVGGLRGVHQSLPSLEVFERRDWLYLSHGKFTGQQCLVWCESNTFEEDSKHFNFKAIGTTVLRKEDPHAPNGVKGPGENSVFNAGISSWEWIENQIRLQHKSEQRGA